MNFLRTSGRGWRAALTGSLLTASAVLVLAACGQEPAAPNESEAAGADAPETTSPVSLFDGKSLGSFEVIGFAGAGEVSVDDGKLIIGAGETLTGVAWKEDKPLPFPLINYEISLEAMKLRGSDFFCALTFPLKDRETSSTLIVGGWGGGVVGISSIDSLDASENETASYHKFEDNKWYKIRLQVQETRFRAWIDDKRVIHTITSGRKLGMRFGDIELCKPLGLATYQTKAAIRSLQVRALKPDEIDGNPH